MNNNDYFYNNYPNNIYAQDGQPLSAFPPKQQTAASQLCVQTMNAPALPQQYEQPPIHQMSAPPLPQPQSKQSIQVQPLLPVLEESPNKQSEERLKPPIDESTSQPHNTETASENVTSADKQKLLCKDLSLITPGSKEYNKLSPKAQKSCDKWFLQSVKEEERLKPKPEWAREDSDKKLLCIVVGNTIPGSPEYEASTPETKAKVDEYYLRTIKKIQEAKANESVAALAASSKEDKDSYQSIVPAVQPVALPNSNLQQNYISCCNPTTNNFSFEINEFGVTELNTGISGNFHIEITTVYILLGDDNSPTDTRYDLTVKTFCRDGYEQIIQLKKVPKEIAQSSKILKRIPMAVVDSKTEGSATAFLYQYINYCVSQKGIKVVSLFKSSGWNTELKAYITASGIIGRSDYSAISMGVFSLHNNCHGYAHHIFEHMLTATRNPANMRIILLYHFASMIYTLFTKAKLSLNHLLFIVGEKGCRKTSLAKCFLQFGEDKTTTRFNFSSSDSGILNCLREYSDRVMLVDDMPPSITTAQKNADNAKLNLLLRIMGDNGTRTINTAFMKNPDQKPDYKVRGGIAITGERFYGSGTASSVARAVVISLDKNEVKGETLTYFQKHENELESLMYRFISYITSYYDVTVENIKNWTVTMRKQAQKLNVKNDRYRDYYAIYMITASLVARYFRSEDCYFDENSFIANSERDIIAILTENDYSYRSSDPIDQLLTAIIFAIHTSAVGSFGTPVSDSCRIVIDGSNLYLRQMDLSGFMKTFSERTNTPVVSQTSEALGALLDDNGYCEVYYEKEGDKLKRRLSKKQGKEFGEHRLMRIYYQKLCEYERNNSLGF